jgi:protein-S-isoprenylcysteine O-methyltransferase Ste14
MSPRVRSGRSVDRWFALGFLGLGGFLVSEALGRAPEARRDGAGADDRNTTLGIVAATVAGTGLAPLLVAWSRPPPRVGLAALGLGLEAAGFGLRTWATTTLGRSYSRTLQVQHHQPLVEDGPYRFLRHPGYCGSLLVWTGFALSSQSSTVLALVAGLVGAAYARRIAVEETLLVRDLPGYDDYRRRTKRLVPFVW